MMRSLMFRLGTATGLAVFLALPATAAAQLVPKFDWSVPERYSADGMIGVRMPFAKKAPTLRILNPEATVGDVAPAGWPADFTACGSGGEIVRFTWTVDGAQAVDSSSCTARITFPREGRYHVELTVLSASGATASTAQEVRIQDWLIVGLGDSYGSGEGVSNVPVEREALVNFEVARAAWEEAAANAEEALAEVARAKAAVDVAKLNLQAAKLDLDGLYDAWNDFLSAQQAVAKARDALTAADAALAKATAAVAAALAKVAFECAQWWDPAGCTAAKTKLAKAQLTQTKAAATRARAADTLHTAQLELAKAVLALPVEGFEYARGVLEARVALMTSRLDLAMTALEAAYGFATSADEILDAAAAALHARVAGTSALWQDTMKVSGPILGEEFPFNYSQCHQSKFSGQALAALELERADPKTSVTFVHLACSGGTIKAGLLGAYAGIEEADGISKRPAQINFAAALTKGREVDAFVTSIGGNDVGFADLITACIVNEPCFVSASQITDAEIVAMCESLDAGAGAIGAARVAVCKASLTAVRNQSAGESVDDVFRSNLVALPKLYASVQTRIQKFWPGLPADRMFLTQYPMISRDENNEICGFYDDPARNLPGLTGPEYTWAEQVAGHLLNKTIGDQEAALGWTVVKGIDEAFRRHGYCSDDTWLIHLKESFMKQVSHTGVVHPNAAGHRAYADKVGAALRRAFYPSSTESTLGAPRLDGRR